MSTGYLCYRIGAFESHIQTTSFQLDFLPSHVNGQDWYLKNSNYKGKSSEKKMPDKQDLCLNEKS